MHAHPDEYPDESEMVAYPLMDPPAGPVTDAEGLSMPSGMNPCSFSSPVRSFLRYRLRLRKSSLFF